LHYIWQLGNGKVAGVGIPPGVWEQGNVHTTFVFQSGSVCTRKTREKSDCSKCPGIILLAIAGKILVRGFLSGLATTIVA